MARQRFEDRRGSDSGTPVAGRSSATLRVSIAIGGLLAIPVVGALMAVALFTSLQGTATSLSDRAIRFARAVDTAALEAKALANDERGFLLSGRTEFLDQMPDRIDQARAAFSEARVAAADDRQLASIDRARQGFERWLTTVDALVASAQAGDRPAAVDDALGPSRTQRKTYEAALADARGLAMDSLAATSAAVAEASMRSTILLIGYVGIALVAGVAIGGWLIRSVIAPAYARLHPSPDPGSSTSRA
jgi:methyl-accepting chemotaxis protein